MGVVRSGWVRAAARTAARAEAGFLGVVTAIVDASGDRVRYGWGHAVRRRLLQRPLQRFRPAVSADPLTGPQSPARREVPIEPEATVVLVTRTLGTGGVESVVATLARRLPGHGVQTVVLCERGGATADALRDEGIHVVVGESAGAVLDLLVTASSPVVAQLHNAPDRLIEECGARGIPLVPVIHTTDVNLSPQAWRAQEALARRSLETIAVSDVVREFTLQHWQDPTNANIVVVPNGVDPARVVPEARGALGELIGADLDSSETVFLCLARYDIQKNIPGLVSAFLEVVDRRPHARLVIAGPVEDWLEFCHADAIRRAHPRGGRVHLLGEGSTAALTSAADAFVLDSFFEGWPVAASEAIMAGIPVVLSDVGGARELVGPHGERGRLCANPAGDPATMSLDDIRRARRRSRHQANRASVVHAMTAVADEVEQWRANRAAAARAAAQLLDADAMARAHARVLLAAAAGSDVAG